MRYDLENENQLRELLIAKNPKERSPDWVSRLASFLAFFRDTDVAERSSKEFHRKIWEDNPVSDVGMGTVNITAAIEDAGFRQWFAEESLKPLGDTDEAIAKRLVSFYDEIIQRIKVFSNRTPYVKIFRVLAALYPRYFTTITDRRLLQQMHRALFGKRKNPGPVRRQLEIRQRLDDLLGPVEDTPEALAERLTIAWILFADYVQPEAAADEAEVVEPSGDVVLKPLPAAQRRKGFTSIKGGLDTIANALRFVVDGVTRQDLMDYLRAEFPDYRESSLRTLINILKNEFYVIQEEGGQISPTERGELFLENSDPQELIPLFITRTLGVDHVLVALKRGAMTRAELIRLLQSANPGWTSHFAPSAMLKWLKDFGLLDVDESGAFSLTPDGVSWAGRIHWQPEKLDGSEKEGLEDIAVVQTDLDINQASLEMIRERTVADTAFAARLVDQLHFGLWSNRKRHFAVLAGLSGSGKTLLAMRYALALAGQFTDKPDSNRYIQAVQPGWYDPAPLFGYVNPLVQDKYERPPFLDFLLRAARYPEQAFVAILDEMNLSHPEQYFAPVLSAMESGEPLRLHNEGESFDGVPAVIPYPSNIAFIGTVNMDETTHGISDKVLDRAFTLEFWDIDLQSYPRWDKHSIGSEDVATVRACLQSLMNSLAPERLHFGWRTVDDLLSYLGMANQSPGFNLTASLDEVVFARILPKLRGAESHRLHDALDKTLDVLNQHGLERSRDKVKSMKADLADTGMMRFWR